MSTSPSPRANASDHADPSNQVGTLADTDAAKFFWHQTLGLRADEIDTDSYTVVWLICDQFHVSRRKAVAQRDAGDVCPVCTNAVLVQGVNDFATTHPAQAACFIKPGISGMRPETASQITRAVATWRCSEGHEFVAPFAQMAARTGDQCMCGNHSGLIRGYNDIAARNPILAAQWDTERNGLPASAVNVGSGTRYWWICPAGHRFKATPRQRMESSANGNGCRLCLWSSPIDPVTHQHVVDAELRPTAAQLRAYFDPPRPPRRCPRRVDIGERSGRKRVRHPDGVKKRAVQLYHEVRHLHRSQLQAQIAVVDALGIDGLVPGTVGGWVSDPRWAHTSHPD
ncbi:zinc-ribbon domain-containing protein [Gordonia sputi]|uniref:zinc-ribbon domain-containing protein n=1 Tax=Gordonia sputi TaxID=36823 RepID=UPI003682DB3A